MHGRPVDSNEGMRLSWWNIRTECWKGEAECELDKSYSTATMKNSRGCLLSPPPRYYSNGPANRTRIEFVHLNQNELDSGQHILLPFTSICRCLKIVTINASQNIGGQKDCVLHSNLSGYLGAIWILVIKKSYYLQDIFWKVRIVIVWERDICLIHFWCWSWPLRSFIYRGPIKVEWSHFSVAMWLSIFTTGSLPSNCNL